jgi:hypothetical protein
MGGYFPDNSISVSGSVYGSVVGGSHNRVESRTTVGAVGADNTQRVLDALDALERLIEQHAADIPEHRLATRDVRQLRSEIEDPEPDPRAAQDTLARLAERGRAVSAVVTAVVQLKELIGGLWPG